MWSQRNLTGCKGSPYVHGASSLQPRFAEKATCHLSRGSSEDSASSENFVSQMKVYLNDLLTDADRAEGAESGT
jgi:hypothetical protein